MYLKRKMSILTVACIVALVVVMLVAALPSQVNSHYAHAREGINSRHGYVAAPYSRVRLGQLNYQFVGDSIKYEPQSLEAPKGWPDAVSPQGRPTPVDGNIASANKARGTVDEGREEASLDEQTSTRWVKNNVNHGDLDIGWEMAQSHVTTKWQYWITKANWDPNEPLTRATFDLLIDIPDWHQDHPNGRPPMEGNFGAGDPVIDVWTTVTIPTTHTGYHIILAVWEIGDTDNSFYNVLDLNIDNSLEVGGLTMTDGSIIAPDDVKGQATSPSNPNPNPPGGGGGDPTDPPGGGGDSTAPPSGGGGSGGGQTDPSNPASPKNGMPMSVVLAIIIPIVALGIVVPVIVIMYRRKGTGQMAMQSRNTVASSGQYRTQGQQYNRASQDPNNRYNRR